MLYSCPTRLPTSDSIIDHPIAFLFVHLIFPVKVFTDFHVVRFDSLAATSADNLLHVAIQVGTLLMEFTIAKWPTIIRHKPIPCIKRPLDTIFGVVKPPTFVSRRWLHLQLRPVPPEGNPLSFLRLGFRHDLLPFVFG
jgi:hypothetical protein